MGWHSVAAGCAACCSRFLVGHGPCHLVPVSPFSSLRLQDEGCSLLPFRGHPLSFYGDALALPPSSSPRDPLQCPELEGGFVQNKKLASCCCVTSVTEGKPGAELRPSAPAPSFQPLAWCRGEAVASQVPPAVVPESPSNFLASHCVLMAVDVG